MSVRLNVLGSPSIALLAAVIADRARLRGNCVRIVRDVHRSGCRLGRRGMDRHRCLPRPVVTAVVLFQSVILTVLLPLPAFTFRSLTVAGVIR